MSEWRYVPLYLRTCMASNARFTSVYCGVVHPETTTCLAYLDLCVHDSPPRTYYVSGGIITSSTAPKKEAMLSTIPAMPIFFIIYRYIPVLDNRFLIGPPWL